MSVRDSARPIHSERAVHMTLDEYEKLPPEEQERFARYEKCGEMFDRRSLDEVLFHTADHKPRAGIQYSGWEKLK